MVAAVNKKVENDPKASAALPAPFRPFGKNPVLTFSLAVGLPAVLLYVGGAVVLLLALVMMAGEMDRLEQQRGVTTMAAALSAFLNGLGTAVADEGTWNEAHLNVVVKPDLAWMDTTWGATARLGTSYDDVMVTDQNGVIEFGENNLGPITGNITARFPAARGMLDELDQAIHLSGDAAVVAHFSADEIASVGLAAISIHKSTHGEMAVPRNQRRILWIAKHLTPGTLQQIAVRYLMPVAEMVTEPGARQSSLNIADPDGNIVGTLAWTPDRPGDAAFRPAAILAFSIYFCIGVLLVLALGGLRRAMVARAARLEMLLTERALVADAVAIAAPQSAPAALAEAPASSAVDGVAASQFTIEYQPILDLRSETMTGVEALLRWTRPDQTPLLQEQLTARECASLMDRAGVMALRQAASEIAPLIGVSLSLAVTPGQLMDGVFAEKVAGTMGATNFPIRRLQLNVDTALLPDVTQIARHLVELRGMGVAIAFANFTLGERTADYLRPGLADRIILAPHMVSLVDADPVRFKLIETTIEVARSASFAVTVANVQRKEEAARLLRLGCREFRGSLLAPPMGLPALTALVLAPARPQRVKQAG